MVVLMKIPTVSPPVQKVQDLLSGNVSPEGLVDRTLLEYVRLVAQHRAYIKTHKDVVSPFLDSYYEKEKELIGFQFLSDEIRAINGLIISSYPMEVSLNGLVLSISRMLD